MEREACVCDHGFERSDLCAEIIIGLPLLRFMRLSLVCFYCLCFFFFFVYRDDVLCWLLSCPSSSVCFPCLSPNFFPV